METSADTEPYREGHCSWCRDCVGWAGHEPWEFTAQGVHRSVCNSQRPGRNRWAPMAMAPGSILAPEDTGLAPGHFPVAVPAHSALRWFSAQHRPSPAPKQAPSDKLDITGWGVQVFSLNKVSSFRKGKEKGFSWSQVLYFHPENSQNSKIRSYTPAQRQHAARSWTKQSRGQTQLVGCSWGFAHLEGNGCGQWSTAEGNPSTGACTKPIPTAQGCLSCPSPAKCSWRKSSCFGPTCTSTGSGQGKGLDNPNWQTREFLLASSLDSMDLALFWPSQDIR